MTRELFPRYTGMTFDVITPAVVAATTPSPASSSRSAPRAWSNSTPSIRRCLGSTR